jgi:hypothetical protein
MSMQEFEMELKQ